MPDLITEEIVHVKGFPKKLVVFLHGYIDSSEGLDKTISSLIDNLDDVAIHIPQAPHICEIHENRRQWYSMHRFDPNDDRKTVATMDECVAFYELMGSGFREAFDYVSPYIDQCIDEYQLEDKDVYLCGFSQGAMLALYIALMRDGKIGGCVSFSGILAPSKYLLKHYRNTPNILLIHGDVDNLVRFEALDFTTQKLLQIGCNVENYVVKGGNHRVSHEGLMIAADYINARFTKRAAV